MNGALDFSVEVAELVRLRSYIWERFEKDQFWQACDMLLRINQQLVRMQELQLCYREQH